MNNKTVVVVVSVLFMLLLAITSFAHSGMTDANGGHWDNNKNEYHYHCGGNPAHKHKGGVCPYDRIPADTSNKGNYGSGGNNSGTRKENTMDIWEIILLGIVGFVVLAVIISAIKEKIQDKSRAKRHEQEKSIIETNDKITELNKKIADLEKENGELKRELHEAKNNVADANYEVIKTREQEQIDINSLMHNLSHAFNDYEVLNKYYRGVTKGKLENAFSTNLTISKILKFDLEAEIISKSDKKISKYNTTFESCTCEDYKFRCQKEGTVCKHMLYLMYSFGVLQLQPERLKASFLAGKTINHHTNNA